MTERMPDAALAALLERLPEIEWEARTWGPAQVTEADIVVLCSAVRSLQARVTELEADGKRLDWLSVNPPDPDYKPMTSIGREQIDVRMRDALAASPDQERTPE